MSLLFYFETICSIDAKSTYNTFVLTWNYAYPLIKTSKAQVYNIAQVSFVEISNILLRNCFRQCSNITCGWEIDQSLGVYTRGQYHMQLNRDVSFHIKKIRAHKYTCLETINFG
jgi:hypothetical protein